MINSGELYRAELFGNKQAKLTIDQLYTKNKTMAYTFAKFLIQRGRVEGMADKLGVLLLGGSITDAQYQELIALIPVA